MPTRLGLLLPATAMLLLGCNAKLHPAPSPWQATVDYPQGIVHAAETIDRRHNARPWVYRNVTPEIYTNSAGRYRVVWFGENSDARPWTWYEFDKRGEMVGSRTSDAGSTLSEPDVRSIPDWD